MSSKSSAVAPPSEAEAPEGVGLLISVIVSYTINPLVLPPLVYGLVLAHLGAPLQDVALGISVGALFLAVIPLAHVAWMRARGDIHSLEIRDRRKRAEPFLVVLVSTLTAVLVVRGLQLHGQGLLVILLGCHFLNTLFLLAITRWWKISVHCASVAGAVATLGFVHLHIEGDLMNPAHIGWLLLGTALVVVPLLVWARVRSRAHTTGQAIAGALLGLIAPYVELSLLILTGSL